jgi:hypothetical protein
MTQSWIRLASGIRLLSLATIALGEARAQAEAQRMVVGKTFAASELGSC